MRPRAALGFPGLVTALAAILAAPSSASGQDTSERPDGIICQTPDCDIRRSLPKAGLVGPLQAQERLVGYLKQVPVSDLDPRLPGTPLEQWLFERFGLRMAANRTAIADWSLGFCEERASAIPGAGPDLCVEVSVPLLTELGAPQGGGPPILLGQRVIKLSIAVANGVYVSSGRTGWTLIPAQLRRIYIDRVEDVRHIDSLDVKSLVELDGQLALPFDEWPAVDFKSAIAWAPEKPLPGNTVTFKITVENTGKRDAERASVHFLLGIWLPCCGESVKEIRREWFPHIPAGSSASFEISALLPRGDAIAHVAVSTGPGMARTRESNPDDNDTTVVISADGTPTDPTASRTSEPRR